MTNFTTYNSSWANETTGKKLDLSNTKLKHLWSSWVRCELILPSTIEVVEQDGNKLPILPEDTHNLKNISIWKVRDLATEQEWESFMTKLEKATNLETFIGGANTNFKFSMLEHLKNCQNLKHFEYNVMDGWSYDKNKDSVDGLKYLTNLETLIVTDLQNIIDISALSNCTKLKYLTFTNARIQECNCLGSMPNLIEVDLSKNQISDIYSLSNCKNLQKATFASNALTDFGTHRDNNGTSKSFETLEIFYELNYQQKGSLKYLNISDNSFDETSMLTELEWPDGKSGF